jgi:hypothetical protein
MDPAQRNWLYRGAVERYAQAPVQKPRMRFPWGLVIALLILIAMYYIVNKMIF